MIDWPLISIIGINLALIIAIIIAIRKIKKRKEEK